VIDRGLVIAAACGVAARSPHWPTVEHEYREAHPVCAGCAATGQIVNVHHMWPFHDCVRADRADLELDERNLITLCREALEHHLLLGHLDAWPSYNEHVAEDCARMRGWPAERIRTDAVWLGRERTRPVAEAPPEQLATFRARLDALLPPDPAVLARFGITLSA
jgi:hypothetical protein